MVKPFHASKKTAVMRDEGREDKEMLLRLEDG